MFISNAFSFNERKELGQEPIESVWAEILIEKSKPLLIGTAYRHPNKDDFYEILESNSAGIGNSETLILGDFNTNVLKRGTPIYKGIQQILCSSLPVPTDQSLYEGV